MAKLFKDKQIKKELDGYQIPNFEQKLDLIRGWKRVYDSKELHKKSESQCEQAFNDDFFVKVLDYVKFPAEKYSIDPKGSTEATAQRPDAILGVFEGESKYVKAVVEIKDVNTPLDKSQRREGNFSPIQQAFKYKPQFKGCAFVIATNFFEIRLFKDNQLDYEVFTLESLVDPKDDYYQFRKFYFLLNFNNFVNRVGQSNTEKLLAHIVVEQETITKAFYKDYSILRKELIKDIVKNNTISKKDWVGVVEKAQKLIDRIVFICFCEDLDLLPDGKLTEVIYLTEKLGLVQPVWDTLKSFFRAIDKGSEKLQIPNGYNGELFKEDVRLENLKISDEICKKFVELGNYDFTEDLSVNILGHIFEQSISDVEEIKSVGVEDFEQGKSISKRKKDGIFYTPDYIVDYIVKNTVGTLLDKKYVELTEKHGLKEGIKDANYEKRALKVYGEYQQYLRGLKILDPACGSGAFLVKVYDFLFAENKRVSDLITDLSGGAISMENSINYIKAILEDNIYGVDLNSESVDITKLSLWLKTAIKGNKLISLGNNIKCGNSLIDDPTVAGVKAFKWEEEFKDVLESGGFDVIIGNPPYVFGGNKGLSKVEKLFFSENYITGKGKVNLFTLFNEKALKLLKDGGELSFIIPNTFLRVTSYVSARKLLLEESCLQKVVNFTENVFADAVTSAIIFVVEKTKPVAGSLTQMYSDVDSEPVSVLQSQFVSLNYVINISSSPLSDKILDKMKQSVVLLGDLCEELIFGVVISGNMDQVVFKEYQPGFKPFVEGKDVSRYFVKPINKWLKYDPKLLHRARTKEVFEVTEKLLIQRITGGSRPLKVAYDKEQLYDKESINNLILKEDSLVNIKYILAFLNSSLINWFYVNQFTNGSTLTVNVSKTYLSLIPIKLVTEDLEKRILADVDNLLFLYSTVREKIRVLSGFIKGSYGYDGAIISEKLLEFDFTPFLKSECYLNLPLEKRSELFSYLQKIREELVKLGESLSEKEDGLDDYIFNIYGLNSEEKEFVRKSFNSN